jgi:hypothetical protein
MDATGQAISLIDLRSPLGKAALLLLVVKVWAARPWNALFLRIF